MAITNLLSTDVVTFPSSLRENYDSNSRLTTEYNMTGLLNRLTGEGSFVSTANVRQGSLTDESKISFTLGGYWFEASLGDLKSAAGSSATEIWAVTTLAYTASSETRGDRRLVGWNGNSIITTNPDILPTGAINAVFSPLFIASSEEEIETFKQKTADTYTLEFFDLKLLTKENGNWIIPAASRRKFDGDSVLLDIITNEEIDEMWG